MEYRGEEISDNELYGYEDLEPSEDDEDDCSEYIERHIERRIRFKEIGESYI